MFIGHFGAGLAGKKAAPRISLGTMFLAAQFLDLLWPVLILAGIEKLKIVPGITASNPMDFVYYPYSHSLFFALIWSILFGAIYYYFRRNLINSSVLGILVLSHWVLDLIVHIPDLPILPWGNLKVGFGLWNYPAATISIEGLIFLLGIYLYLNATRTKNRKGTYGFWGLMILLLIIHFANTFSPPPPSVEAIGYAGLLQWLFILWAYWIDRNRISAAETTPQMEHAV
jgi:hypothetical protein